MVVDKNPARDKGAPNDTKSRPNQQVRLNKTALARIALNKLEKKTGKAPTKAAKKRTTPKRLPKPPPGRSGAAQSKDIQKAASSKVPRASAAVTESPSAIEETSPEMHLPISEHLKSDPVDSPKTEEQYKEVIAALELRIFHLELMVAENEQVDPPEGLSIQASACLSVLFKFLPPALVRKYKYWKYFPSTADVLNSPSGRPLGYNVKYAQERLGNFCKWNSENTTLTVYFKSQECPEMFYAPDFDFYKEHPTHVATGSERHVQRLAKLFSSMLCPRCVVTPEWLAESEQIFKLVGKYKPAKSEAAAIGGAPAGGYSTMTAVGGAHAGGRSTMTAVGGAPAGGSSTMIAVGGAPAGGSSTTTAARRLTM